MRSSRRDLRTTTAAQACKETASKPEHEQDAPSACSMRGSEVMAFACRESTYGLFVVNDGHNGATAARYVADMLSDYLQPLLPRGGPPQEKHRAEFAAWRHAIQRALTVAMALLHRSFAAKGVLAGCTSTVVLQVRRPTVPRPCRGWTQSRSAIARCSQAKCLVGGVTVSRFCSLLPA